MIPDGIYLNLPAEAYLADPALGSGDLKDCLLQVVQWHGRKRNPIWRDHLRPKGKDADVEGIHQAFGHALHCAVLEPDAFDERYMIEPETPDWPKTIEEIRRAVQHSGNGHFLPDKPINHSAHVAAARAANVKTAADWADELRLMAAGRIQISAKWKFELLTLQRVIERHSVAGKWVRGGRSEVSVFYTDEHGHRYKCRFDYLKIGRVCDIKTYGIKKGKTPVDSFLQARDDFAYDFSAAHYMDMRVNVLPDLVKAGAIFEVFTAEEVDGVWQVGFEEAPPADVAFMDKVAAHDKPTWAWLAAAKFGIPEVDIVVFPDDLLAWSAAAEQVKEAKRNYQKMREIFGDDDESMWTEDRGTIVLNETNFSLRSTNRGARTYDTI